MLHCVTLNCKHTVLRACLLLRIGCLHAVVALIGCRRARDLPASKGFDGDEYRQAESGSFGPGSPEKDRSTSFGFLRMLAPRSSTSRRGFWTASMDSEHPPRAHSHNLDTCGYGRRPCLHACAVSDFKSRA